MKARGDAPAAIQKAQAAWKALDSSGLREAMAAFPPKITTRGEFGIVATINVKHYGAYLALQDRIRAVWPSAPAADHNTPPDRPLHVVVKTPPSIQVEKQPIAVRAAVIGPSAIREVKLGYRSPGQQVFQYVPMNLVFRKTYEGVVPAEAVTQAGIEFCVEAKDAAGSAVCAPKGYPAVTYSASVVPAPSPLAYAKAPTTPKPAAPADSGDLVAGLKAQISGPFEVTLSWSKAMENDPVAHSTRSTADRPLISRRAKIPSWQRPLRPCTTTAALLEGRTSWYAVIPRDASGSSLCKPLTFPWRCRRFRRRPRRAGCRRRRAAAGFGLPGPRWTCR